MKHYNYILYNPLALQLTQKPGPTNWLHLFSEEKDHPVSFTGEVCWYVESQVAVGFLDRN